MACAYVRSEDEFLAMLRRLLPAGRAWDRWREADTSETALLGVFAAELARLDLRAGEVVCEFFPGTASEMLNEWELVFFGAIQSGTPEERRLGLLAKVSAYGGQSIDYFYGIAETLGYNRYPSTTDPHIRIADGEFFGFRADIGRADVDKVYDQDTGNSIFTWSVYGTDVESDTVLQSLFNNLKPAHTEVFFHNE